LDVVGTRHDNLSALLYLVTLLDTAIVCAGSAAVVVLLGGRTRFVVEGVRVSLRTAAPLAEIAAALLLIRLIVFGFVRALPAFSRAVDSFEQQRTLLLRRSPLTRRVFWYAAAAVAGSLLWELPQLIHLRHVSDPYDPVFSAWRLASLAHQLATDPRHLWNGNIFYPLPLTLTYSDSLFLQGLLGAPFIWSGVDPLLVANVMMAISFPARGLAFFVLAWRLTDDPQVALVAALLGAWSPFYPQHYSQLEMQWTMFVPPVILLLLQTLAGPRWKTGLLLGVTFGAQALSCMYVALMLATWLVPFGALIALAWKVRPTRALAAALLMAAIVPAAIGAFVGVSYTKARAVHGDWSLAIIYPFSAEPKDYGDAHPWLATYRGQSSEGHHAERELFPGSSTLVLAGAALLPPLGSIPTAALVSGALAFDWSLGVNGLTYDDLRRRLPPFRSIRVPARFAVFVDTSLVILCIFGAGRLLNLARGRRRAIVCAALAVAVLIDLRVAPALQAYPSEIPSIYASVTPDMVLAELPEKDREIDYMYFSTKHWAHLLGGYSGFFPPLDAFNRAAREFPEEDAIATFRRLGATHLTYNCAFEASRQRCTEVLGQLDANASLQLIATGTWRAAPVALYRFK
jgi:hypothetical protein